MDARFRQLAASFPLQAYKEVKIGRGYTTIDAYHIVERLTSVFGLCGTSWGIDVKEWRHEGGNVLAIGSLWYVDEGEAERHHVTAVGDASIIKDNIAEAYKKAQTNLMSKAASFIGVGLSVYQGKGIDDPCLDRAHEAGSTVTSHEHIKDGNPLAQERDWDQIKAARMQQGLSSEQVARMMDDPPFCVDGNPYDLLAIHVPALIERIMRTEANGL